VIRSRTARLLGLVLAIGCGDAALEPETPAPLDPVDRTATLVWVLDEADPGAVSAALSTLEDTVPTTVLLGGENVPDPAAIDDPRFEALLAQVELAAEAVGRRIEIAIELPALPPGDPGPFCFDRTDPFADPAIAERTDDLGRFLRAFSSVRDVILSFDVDPRSWAAECACSTCESQLPNDLAVRMTTLFAAYSEPVATEFRTLWWWDRATTEDPTAVDPGSYMDLALGTVNRDRHLSLRLMSMRGPDHPWGANNPRIAATEARRMAIDLDPAGTRFGPGGAYLFLLDDLYDRARRHRAASAIGWYVDLGGEGRRAPGDLAGEASLRFIGELFRNFEADPDEVLAAYLADEIAVPGDDDLHDLASALRASGRALDLATHPLGISVDLDMGIPATFPVVWIDPREDPRWAVRWFELTSPDRATAAAIHQWGAEATALVADALEALALAQDQLRADAALDLEQGLHTLDVWVRAWHVVVDADTALRFVIAASAGPERDEAYAWLRADAARLRALGAEIQAGLASDTYRLPVPVDPTALLALAAEAEAEAGPGEATERPFPILTRITHAMEADRFTVRWEVDPAAGGSIEWGTAWPVYDDGGNGDDEPTTRWSAWREQTPGADVRVTFRA
jgi:hypothetical protein